MESVTSAGPDVPPEAEWPALERPARPSCWVSVERQGSLELLLLVQEVVAVVHLVVVVVVVVVVGAEGLQ